jgi:hypothetical protein
MNLKNESVTIRLANKLAIALNELEENFNGMPTKDFYEASDYETPEEAADWLVTEVADNKGVAKDSLWSALKNTETWRNFVKASQSWLAGE